MLGIETFYLMLLISLLITSIDSLPSLSRSHQTSLVSFTSAPSVLIRRSLLRAYNTIIQVSTHHTRRCIDQVDRNVSLSDYMRLPVEQYVCIEMPLHAHLERIESNRFQLTVPPVTFFHLQVCPTVYCSVAQNNTAVIIQSDKCNLAGSPYVRSLNGCFRFTIRTVFTWVDRPTYRQISSTSDLFVEVDPPPPFSSVPVPILERTGQLAMTAAISFIEGEFIKSLAKDYARWATDEKYRLSRVKQSLQER